MTMAFTMLLVVLLVAGYGSAFLINPQPRQISESETECVMKLQQCFQPVTQATSGMNSDQILNMLGRASLRQICVELTTVQACVRALLIGECGPSNLPTVHGDESSMRALRAADGAIDYICGDDIDAHEITKQCIGRNFQQIQQGIVQCFGHPQTWSAICPSQSSLECGHRRLIQLCGSESGRQVETLARVILGELRCPIAYQKRIFGLENVKKAFESIVKH